MAKKERGRITGLRAVRELNRSHSCPFALQGKLKEVQRCLFFCPVLSLTSTYLENSVHPCGDDFSSMSFELQVKSHSFQVTFNNNPICFHTIFCFPYQPEFGGLFCLCCRCSVAKSCPTLQDPTDCRPPGSSVHGILQARILECVAILFSRGSS